MNPASKIVTFAVTMGVVIVMLLAYLRDLIIP